eukprot:TRINITY_DN3003_c0_g1_i1.p1 TRINITY_DN3003_c0_g1~~TRINITY_DN3003_c0_g1_i1.p1  ORF type:complete len:286 (-),score=83.34 TRINITY_DN3003_c0_g1_i1:24-770(-)
MDDVSKNLISKLLGGRNVWKEAERLATEGRFKFSKQVATLVLMHIVKMNDKSGESEKNNHMKLISEAAFARNFPNLSFTAKKNAIAIVETTRRQKAPATKTNLQQANPLKKRKIEQHSEEPGTTFQTSAPAKKAGRARNAAVAALNLESDQSEEEETALNDAKVDPQSTRSKPRKTNAARKKTEMISAPEIQPRRTRRQLKKLQWDDDEGERSDEENLLENLPAGKPKPEKQQLAGPMTRSRQRGRGR